jgi:hypothetical protein
MVCSEIRAFSYRLANKFLRSIIRVMVINAGNEGAKIDISRSEAMARTAANVGVRWTGPWSSRRLAVVGRGEGSQQCEFGRAEC